MSYRDLGLNGATISSADLKKALEATKNAGFKYYEPRVPQLLSYSEHASVASAVELLNTCELSWLPLNALEGLFEKDLGELENMASEVFLLARDFGIGNVIIVPGKVRERKISRSQAIEIVKQVKKIAEGFGLALLYEMIGFTAHYFPTIADSAIIAEESGVPLVIDTFHLAVSKAKLKEITRLSPNSIGLVHLSDALTEGKTPEELGDGDRVLPGEGGLHLAGILEAIHGAGYQGPVSVEVFHSKYKERDPYEVAGEAYRRAQTILQAAGWTTQPG